MFPTALPSPLFDKSAPGTGAFAPWRRALAGVFDVAATPEEIGLFAGEFALVASARYVLSAGETSRLQLVRSTDTIARGGLDHFGIRLVRSGALAGLAGPIEVEAQAGDVVFIDLLHVLHLQASARGGQTADVTLWVPRARFLAAISDEHVLHGFAVSGSSPAGALIAAALIALSEQAGRASAKEMDALASGVLELIAKALLPALAALSPAEDAVPLASFVTLRRYIDRNLGQHDLGADTIAKNFGLSRASVYRLFEPAGGIASYIRKQRLDRAYQEITAPGLGNRRIGPIAYRWGFGNVSAFNRLFRETFGVSPRAARAGAAEGLGGAQTLASPELGELAQALARTGRG